MKLYLKNFKHFEQNIFDLEDKGIQLLSGHSGRGKSTILDAIYFCLYGNLQKIVRYGKTSCEVKIEYDNMIITRTKRPNRLELIRNEEIFEDEVAQGIIDTYFGQHFNLTSYVRQNINQTFLYMSPTEKLEFLEDCVLKKYNIDTFKDKIRDFSKELDKDINILSGQLSTYNEILSTTKEPEKITFPIKCSSKNIGVVSKNERVKKKNAIILLKKYTKELEDISKTISNNESYISKLETIKIKLKQEQEIHEHYDTKIKELSFDESKKIHIENEISKIKKYMEYTSINETLEKEKSIYNQKLQDEKTNINEQLGEDKYRFSEEDIQRIEKDIEILKTKISNKTKRDKLNRELSDCDVETDYTREDVSQLEEENRELLSKIDLSKKRIQCPKCNCGLIYNGDKVIVYVDNLDISELKEKLEENRELISEIIPVLDIMEKRKRLLLDISKIPDEEITESVDDLKKRYKTLLELSTEKKRLEKLLKTEDFPSLNRSREIIKEYERKLTKYTNVTRLTHTYDLEELKAQLADISSKKILYIDYTERRDAAFTNISRLNSEIRSLEDSVINIFEIKDKKIDVYAKIEESKKQLELSTEITSKIELWEKYNEELEKYNRLRFKVSEINDNLDRKKKEYTNISILRDKIIQAESLCITQFIDTINIHAQIYLDYFFKTDQIFVNIQTHKEIKKGSKPMINLSIEYKGHSVELHNLSGGERDRINLAFTLALSEIFQSPILMLDECISSLDYDNCSNVLQTIRECYKGKSVICVHHQANEGLFDNVIKV
jgi:exonuclease SbcC